VTRDMNGAPLTPGVNVDPVDVGKGMTRALALGYGDTGNDRLTVEYALRRHARGEEDGAVKTWLGHFGKSALTGWYAVLAAAVAS
jgi:hypothetical protein